MNGTTSAPEPRPALAVAEVDMSVARSQTRGVVAYLKAPARHSPWTAMPVAALTWEPTSAAVEIVYVVPEHRRQKIATDLWAAALSVEPDLGHSRDRSPDGTAWAAAVGGTIPPIEVDRDAQDMERRGARLLDALWGFGPERVIRSLPDLS